MKDWVKPFLIQRMKEALDEDEELYPDREKIMDRRKKELEDEDAVYYELTYYFNVDFGGGLGWPIDHMITAFGSVKASTLLHSDLDSFNLFDEVTRPSAEPQRTKFKEIIEITTKIINLKILTAIPFLILPVKNLGGFFVF